MIITPEQLAASGTEDGHQMALMNWCNQNRHNYPDLDLLFAIPNGGHRNKSVAARLKATGVKTGVPDLFLPISRGEWMGLFIELKRPKSNDKQAGKASDNQLDWINRLRAEGYGAMVCVGWEAARDALILYLIS